MTGLAIIISGVALWCWLREIERRERAEAEKRESDVSWELLHDAMVARAMRWQGRAVEAERHLLVLRNPPRSERGQYAKRG